MGFFKAIAKFFRILFMLAGLFVFLGLAFMVVTESGRNVIKNYSVGPTIAYLIVGGVIALSLFLFIYNIIMLSKGIDVFFWLIFKHKAYRELYPKKSKRKNKQPKKEKPTVDTPKVEENTMSFGSNDIIMILQRIGSMNVGYSDNKLYINDVNVIEKGKNNYQIKIDLVVKLIDPPKDAEQVADFKIETNKVVNKMADECNERLSPYAKEYSFSYEIEANTRIEK